jgi:hypothetical protein
MLQTNPTSNAFRPRRPRAKLASETQEEEIYQRTKMRLRQCNDRDQLELEILPSATRKSMKDQIPFRWVGQVISVVTQKL